MLRNGCSDRSRINGEAANGVAQRHAGGVRGDARNAGEIETRSVVHRNEKIMEAESVPVTRECLFRRCLVHRQKAVGAVRGATRAVVSGSER